jgi:hypothetical protein
MLKLLASLRDSDEAVLAVIARHWGAEADRDILQRHMLDPEQAARVWERLTDEQRGAFHTLLGHKGVMPMVMAEQLLGAIRPMGRGQIQREKPLENPASHAEALFYRGLIYRGFDQAPAGSRPVLYVPPDLADALPTHKTTYDDMDEVTQEATITRLVPLDPDILEDMQTADTTIVDDMTALLGYGQVFGAAIGEDGRLDTIDQEEIQLHLLNPSRLDFLFLLAISADLIAIQDRRAAPRRAEARRWLEDTRANQVRKLADAWLSSTVYVDLWHVPGLYPDPSGWSTDPVVARQAVMSFLRNLVPRNEWWSVDDFIQAVKETEPDFQRPGSDYDSWYIRNEGGEYLKGFESWDAVEGALLEFYFYGPMHWLGLVDLAQDAVKLNAYGRALVDESAWPEPAEKIESITVQDDATLVVSRHVPRIDRFQAMRFTSWLPVEQPPFILKVNLQGVQQAAEQGINTGHIAAFLSRMVDPLPEPVTQLLESWQNRPDDGASVEQMLVLRTTAPETLDFIWNEPDLRRFIRARLGPMAAAVRADQLDNLRDALGQHGIDLEII